MISPTGASWSIVFGSAIAYCVPWSMQTYYKLSYVDRRIDNPEQRICEDIPKLCDGLGDLLGEWCKCAHIPDAPPLMPAQGVGSRKTQCFSHGGIWSLFRSGWGISRVPLVKQYLLRPCRCSGHHNTVSFCSS